MQMFSVNYIRAIPAKIGVIELLENVISLNLCMVLAWKSLVSLAVNFRGLQREREVPGYTKCICDHQKNGGRTLNERLESLKFIRNVINLPI